MGYPTILLGIDWQSKIGSHRQHLGAFCQGVNPISAPPQQLNNELYCEG